MIAYKSKCVFSLQWFSNFCIIYSFVRRNGFYIIVSGFILVNYKPFWKSIKLIYEVIWRLYTKFGFLNDLNEEIRGQEQEIGAEELPPFLTGDHVFVKLKLLNPNDFRLHKTMVWHSICYLNHVNWNFPVKTTHCLDKLNTILDIKKILVRKYYEIFSEKYFVVYKWERSTFVPLDDSVKLTSIKKKVDSNVSLRYNLLYFPRMFDVLN